ncbi:hypothetical protein [Aeromicrobium massiliense]|uniref:hypothetical protein n=1 Tax=Aeromicrobium massiliense TaxID=1464554 RepID=UPI0002E36105|nr:hypothetical protein [Aeromicrobium massiliense]
MRLTFPRRAVRLTAVAAVASALVVGGATSPANAAERPAVPSAKTFVDHAVNSGSALTFKVGSKGVVKSWSLFDVCGTKLSGKKLTFKDSRLKATKKVKGSKVSFDLRVASKKVVVGEVTIKAKDRDCSATYTVVSGTKGAWKKNGEAIAVNTLLAYTGVVDWAARDYKERTGRFPSSKTKLVRHAKRLGITSSKEFGERVTAYESKRKGKGFVVTLGTKRGTDVRIEFSSSYRFDWVL